MPSCRPVTEYQRYGKPPHSQTSKKTKVPRRDRRYVSNDIEKYRNEGYPPKQASAIAYSRERRRIAQRRARSIS